MARKNPSEALEWAGQLPEDRGLPSGSDAFGERRRSLPEIAMKQFNDLPSTDVRRQPCFQSAIR